MSEVSIVTIAKICHEANRVYCESLGDDSQKLWFDAPEWQRESCINGVHFHLSGISKGIKPKPESSHQNWMAEKLANGWRYGPVKDPEKKQHPCLVPYEKLPEDQRRKDALFCAIVAALAG